MAFLKKEHQEIYEAMVADLRNRLPEITDFEKGSVIRSLLETIAFEQAVLYQQLDHVYNSSFINTATGLNLEKVVAILDINRNEPDYASGKVTFYKEAGWGEKIIIPIGTQIVTEDNPDEEPQRKAYKTIEEGILLPDMNSVDVKVQADLRGREMETKKDTLIVLPAPISGIEHVTNTDPVDFLGRDRETDEELRLRAKKTLLAAGRASETSIEQALMAMPNVLDVKVKEEEDQPGVIHVYVDGLEERNSKALKDRLDEVRAAGIYAHLKPALLMDFNGIFKLIPHEDVIDEELQTLEQTVSEFISKYIRLKKMGEPLSITQLSAEILKVKGVKDIAKYDIVLANQALVPADVDEINFTTTDNPANENIRFLFGKDANGHEMYRIPKDSKNIMFSDYGRFSPKNISVAGSDKLLPIQFRVKVVYPYNNALNSIKEKIQQKLDDLNFSETEIAPADLDLSPEIITKYKAIINNYWSTCKSDVIFSMDTLRVNPLADHESEFLEWMKLESGLFETHQENQNWFFSMDVVNVKSKFHDLVKTVSDGKTLMKEAIKTGIKSIVEKIAAGVETGFPQSDIWKGLIADATLDLKSKLDNARNQITVLNQSIANDQLSIVTNNLGGQTVETIKSRIIANQALAITEQEKSDNFQNQINNISNSLENLLKNWVEKAEDKMEELATPASLNNFTTGTTVTGLGHFDLALTLRALTFDGKEYFNTPVPVRFMEKPTFDYLWVYSKELCLIGTLNLDLPVTLSSVAKSEIYDNVKTAVSKVLSDQRPETDIEIEALISAAKSQQYVLGAHFQNDTLGLIEEQVERKLVGLNRAPDSNMMLAERVTDKAITVISSEMVVLSNNYFFIKG